MWNFCLETADCSNNRNHGVLRQIQPKPFIRNSQKVIDRAESSVDNSTALEVSTLSPCIFLAMTKQATVVGEPAIIRIAIIWL